MQLSGELSKVNLPSLIQMVRNGELTGKICLTQGINTAFVFVDCGRVFHVETDAAEGKEALLDLFLWTSGTFSYVDCPVDQVAASIHEDEPLDRLLRDGIAYSEAKRYLDQLRIGPSTLLKLAPGRQSGDDALLRLADGTRSVNELGTLLSYSRFELAQALYRAIGAGSLVAAEPPPVSDRIVLPDWVVSRLRQDNSDVSQAIVQMVIWVDRLKCWMYQADADLERVIESLETPLESQSAVAVPAVSTSQVAPAFAEPEQPADH